MNRPLITTTTLVAAVPLLLSAGCTFYARDADAYRQVTRELVETRASELETCYDVALQTNETVEGEVVLNFVVEKKTGKLMNPVVDPKTTAPAELAKCVLDAVDGLQLDPPDAREGQATFTWRFQVPAA